MSSGVLQDAVKLELLKKLAEKQGLEISQKNRKESKSKKCEKASDKKI